MESCPVGRARLRAVSGDHYTGVVRDITIVPGRNVVDIDIPWGVRVSGEVGLPKDAGWMNVNAYRGRLTAKQILSQSAQVDWWRRMLAAAVDGPSFEFSEIPPGTVTLCAEYCEPDLPGGNTACFAAVETIEVGESDVEGIYLELTPEWELLGMHEGRS